MQFDYTAFYAITTEYRGATDKRGSRIWCKSGNYSSRAYPYKHELSMVENHAAAAREYAKDMKMQHDHYQGGCLEKGKYVFVRV